MSYSKEENEIHHFNGRLAERLGIQPSQKLYLHFVKLVQDGHSKFCKRHSRRISVHDVPFDGQWLRILYDTKRSKAVTVLFALTNYHGTRKDAMNHACNSRGSECSARTISRSSTSKRVLLFDS